MPTHPHCNIHWNALQHTATHPHCKIHWNALQHTATHCNILQHTAAHCSTLQHTATHCNILQHTHLQILALQKNSTRGPAYCESCIDRGPDKEGITTNNAFVPKYLFTVKGYFFGQFVKWRNDLMICTTELSISVYFERFTSRFPQNTYIHYIYIYKIHIYIYTSYINIYIYTYHKYT